MATTKEYANFILERINLGDRIFARPMMREYLLYLDGTLFGGIYDSRLLIKKSENNSRFGLSEAIPYPGAKPMYFAEDVENTELLQDIIFITAQDLRK